MIEQEFKILRESPTGMFELLGLDNLFFQIVCIEGRRCLSTLVYQVEELNGEGTYYRLNKETNFYKRINSLIGGD